MAIKMLGVPREIHDGDGGVCGHRVDSVRTRQNGHEDARSAARRSGWGRDVCVLACLIVAPYDSPLRAQVASAPAAQTQVETATFMNRALQQYDNGDYQASIDGLTRLLQLNPKDTTARFFRALAYGQLAVPNERRALAARSQNRPDEAAQQERTAAEQYAAMRKDIDELLRGGLTNANAIVQLIDGVVETKLAGYATGDYKERVAARADLLAHARQAFENYLRPRAGSGLSAPTGMNRLRGEYFLGVVTYRQGLRPAEEAGQPDETVDRKELETASGVMESLVDPASDKYVKKLVPSASEAEASAWLSYANLYLGLVRLRQGNDDALEGGSSSLRYYTYARGYFERAWELDTGQKYPQGEDKSAGRGLIPQIAQTHIPAIDQALKGPAPVEDIFVNLETGLAYDTNVILLGHHTALPRNIGGQKDIRFGIGTAVGYTLDLAKLSPNLDRWTFGAMGRASSNWHGGIYEYNEQNYGGSIALQYRMLDAAPANGRTQGPLYASVQYDYDDFLLGNKQYLRLHRVSPQFTWYGDDRRSVTSFGFHYEDRGYSQEPRDHRFTRAGNYFAFDLSQSYDLVDMTALYKKAGLEPWGFAHDPADPATYNPADPTQDTTDYDRWLRPYIGMQYGWDSTRGQEFDTNRYLLVAGINVPLPYGVQFLFSGQWEWQDYYHDRSLVDYRCRSRDDLIQRYRFGFERQFVLVPGNRINRTTPKIDRLVMSLRGDVQFTNDDSNVKDRLGEDIFSYNRTIWGISASFQFN